MFASLQFEFLEKLQEKIDARIIRERALIFLTALAFIFMFWNFIVQSPIDKKNQEIQTSIDVAIAQRKTLQEQISVITTNLLNDPNKLKKEQIAQLNRDVAAVEDQLQRASQNLIKAEQLPQALQDVLQKTSQLTLLEVKTLPAQELHFVDVNAAPANNAQQASEQEESAGVYQHVVELKVSGNFNQIVQLLTSLEHLPWRFYWQSLDYKVDHYPNAEVILRVYTLSSEEGLFGV